MKPTFTMLIIGAAVVLIVVVAVLVRMDDPTRAPVAVAPPAERDAAAAVPQERGSQPRERLDALRKSYAEPERRAAGDVRLGTPRPGRQLLRTGEDDFDPDDMNELETRLVNHPDPDERIDSIVYLSLSDDPRVVEILLKGLMDPEAQVRLAAVEALADFADELDPTVLYPALNDPDAEVRFEAVSVLGEIENPRALDIVRQAINDPDEDVRILAEGIIEFAVDDEE